MSFDASNFALEGLNACLELVLRKWPKVLLHQLGQRILRLTGKEVILVHMWNR